MEIKIFRQTEKRRFTFKRWFQHWCAFQLVAFQTYKWQPKYLLHDFDKPILNLILSSSQTTHIHRKYSKHHIKNGKVRDIVGCIIDTQCAHLTKNEKPLLSFEFYLYHLRSKLSINDRIKFLEEYINMGLFDIDKLIEFNSNEENELLTNIEISLLRNKKVNINNLIKK